MAQISRYCYFVIDDGLNPIRTVGDQYVPKTITITGIEKAEKRIEFGASTTAKRILTIGASGEIASADFIAVRSTVAGYLVWAGDADPTDTSALRIEANEWFTMLGDDTLAHGGDNAEDRCVNTTDVIAEIWFVPTAVSADVDLIAYT